VTQEYTSLHLSSLDREQHARTCNYWYVLTTYGGSPFTAFRTRAHALAWFRLYGLTIPDELPTEGTWSTRAIEGMVRYRMHGSYGEFFNIEGVDIRAMSNGDYTLGIVSQDPDGVFVQNVLNPNCRRRPLFDHAQSREREDRGILAAWDREYPHGRRAG